MWCAGAPVASYDGGLVGGSNSAPAPRLKRGRPLVSGVKSNLVRFLDFLDFFWIFGCSKTGLHSRDLDTQKCCHSALLLHEVLISLSMENILSDP